jgi:biofilm protein TabA
LLVMAILFAHVAGFAQQQPTVSKKAIVQWVNKKEWANGLQLNPHKSVDKDSFYVAYHRNKKLWDAAFLFLKTQDLAALTPGKHPIVGDTVFASVTDAPSRQLEDVKWESHKNYVDLQYIIRGKEMIGVADTSTALITQPYTVDVINYTAKGVYYTTDPDHFFLFFPNNAHRPTIKVEGYDVVKKIVIKIQTAPAEQ